MRCNNKITKVVSQKASRGNRHTRSVTHNYTRAGGVSGWRALLYVVGQGCAVKIDKFALSKTIVRKFSKTGN